MQKEEVWASRTAASSLLARSHPRTRVSRGYGSLPDLCIEYLGLTQRKNPFAVTLFLSFPRSQFLGVLASPSFPPSLPPLTLPTNPPSNASPSPSPSLPPSHTLPLCPLK
ncbi:hypothetical protein FA13DRAFT_592377 [Coprinellus micaceus]|uniref:Uncharacterized protein n=1 Tax=Coprinellus micaceus TaxID=71717 RepID=A0A4Y7SAA0_COPMI|nr:hypothetical protein FA13DRAFT_592377 [Coprinellus micaceus]